MIRPLLVLATTGPGAEVGLALPGPGGVHALHRQALGAGAARGRDLLPAVQRLLGAAGLAPRDLAAVLVDRGPGSFTGVRLGVTAAKGLALGLSIPVLGLESLEVLCHAAPHEHAVLAVRDAGRGTVYATLHGPAPAPGGARAVRHAPARLAASDLRTLDPEALLVGEEAVRLASEHALPQRPLLRAADAPAVLALGLRRLAEGAAHEALHLVPTYLQASAPERLRAGEAAGAGGGASRTKGADAGGPA